MEMLANILFWFNAIAGGLFILGLIIFEISTADMD